MLYKYNFFNKYKIIFFKGIIYNIVVVVIRLLKVKCKIVKKFYDVKGKNI